MLMMDHKYRELKGHYQKGDTDKISEVLNVPIHKIKNSSNSIDPEAEIDEATSKLQR